MKKAMQNTGATAILISFAGIGGVLDQGASPVNLLMLAFIGIICCLAADRLQETKKKERQEGKPLLTIAQEELINRIRGMEKEEYMLALKEVPTDLLWGELISREMQNRQKLHGISRIIEGGTSQCI